MGLADTRAVERLQRLHGASLDAQAGIARTAAAQAGAGDAAFLDTAACLAGVTPAWTGGPLTWADAGDAPA
jgi:3-hydroxyacyl-CoA dehydrogenase/enoyl-CoA hydratase/3-hydroxybutyryl-CoA epimerase